MGGASYVLKTVDPFPEPAAVFRLCSSISGLSSLSPISWLAALQAAMHHLKIILVTGTHLHCPLTHV